MKFLVLALTATSASAFVARPAARAATRMMADVAVEEAVEPAAPAYPTLNGWTADESKFCWVSAPRRRPAEAPPDFSLPPLPTTRHTFRSLLRHLSPPTRPRHAAPRHPLLPTAAPPTAAVLVADGLRPPPSLSRARRASRAPSRRWATSTRSASRRTLTSQR